jgi:hypothetical protein
MFKLIMLTLDEIFSKNNTDKGPSFHNYSRQYQELLSKYRTDSLKYLEIGVLNGGSIASMREVFPNATCILGLDINPNCKQFEDSSKNIFVEIGNATNSTFISEITKKYGTFDIILDDGSHRNDDVIVTFEMLFPLLNDNGLYIVEDTICFKSSNYLNRQYPDHLSYFFRYTPFLNQWRFDSTQGTKDHCVDPFKIQKKSANVFEQSIDKIEYGCSYIAIHKKVRTNWL